MANYQMKTTILCLFIAFCSLANAQTNDWAWAKITGNPPSQLAITLSTTAKSMATDTNGNIFVLGEFTGQTITIGATTFANKGAVDLFLAKYDPQGNVLWAKNIAGPGYEYAAKVVVDMNGDLYINGHFRSDSIMLDTITLLNPYPYYSKSFLAKYDNSGNLIWIKSPTNTFGAVFFSGLSIDNQGHVYSAGGFTCNSVTFGSVTLTNNIVPSSQFFVAKHDSNGNTLWAKSSDTTNSCAAGDICVDTAGSVFVSGSHWGTGGFYDIFMAKYGANGNKFWRKNFGTNYDENISGIGTYQGNVYISGYFTDSTIVFGGDTLTNLNPIHPNSYIAKCDGDGNFLWARGASNSTEQNKINSLFVDNKGSAYGIGYFESPSIGFGSMTVNNTNNFLNDAFAVKVDSFGKTMWLKKFGGQNHEQGNVICVDNADDILVAGQMASDTIVFGNIVLVSTNFMSSYDMFIAKLSKTTDVEDKIFTQNMQIYPNPFTNTATLDLGNVELHDANIQIYSILGQKIKEIPHISGSKINLERINMNSGTYFIHISEKDKLVSVGKLLIID